MPPKARRQNAAEKSKQGEEEREEPLQAVVLADSFETKFSPFTLERPRCLLPLANTPLIEYTLEFLANAGVEEVFIQCGAHTSLVEEYIEQSKWKRNSSPFEIHIMKGVSRSIGDAMRDLDKSGLLVGDFLVVYGDVVANVPIDAALAEHRARREKDKNAIMTMILREAGTTHRAKAQRNLPVFVIDPSKDRCLQYEQMQSTSGRGGRVNVEAEILSSTQELEIRQDLIDCGIDICTPDVLALWSDNFDYEAPRKGFLHSVLKDYELNGKTIHAHVVSEHYAVRVRNLGAYDAVSKDVVGRWSYPLCPDSNLLRGQSYRLGKGNIYKEDGVMLARNCVIGRRSVIGRDSSVGSGSSISNSVIGRRCVIGRNVTIEGSYIWDDATVKDGSVVTKAIIANEAVIGKRCTIKSGALISYAVVVGDGATIAECSRITRTKRKRMDDEEVSSEPPDVKTVGRGDQGFQYANSDEENDDGVEGLIKGQVYNMEDLSLSSESISTLDSDASSEDQTGAQSRTRTESFISVGSEDSAGGHTARQATDFHHEAAGSIFDSLQKDDDPANVQLELTSLRMTANASESQVRRALAEALTKHITRMIEESEGATSPTSAVSRVVKRYKTLVERSVFDRGEEVERKVDQVDLLLKLQSNLLRRAHSHQLFMQLAVELYNADVLDPEAVEQWWECPDAVATEDLSKLRDGLRPFVSALSAMDSEDDSDEEDDE